MRQNTVATNNPGDVATEELDIDRYPVDDILRRSGVAVPKDWRAVRWVTISDTNTR